jgi:glyoxylase-like metal-dependent hydrolase (beta-lactamase superfamily II)
MNWNDVSVEKIGDIFYVFRCTRGANIGACVIDNAALLIDTGYLPKKSAELITLIEQKLGCRVELAFNTHYHSDHTFGNQSISCPILASAKTRKAMQDCLSTHWNDTEIASAVDHDSQLEEEWEDLIITPPTDVFEGEEQRDFHGVRVKFETVGAIQQILRWHISLIISCCFPVTLFSADYIQPFYITMASLSGLLKLFRR